MATTDSDYYRRRAEQERARAGSGSDPMVANVHLALARMYEERVRDGSGPALRVVAG